MNIAEKEALFTKVEKLLSLKPKTVAQVEAYHELEWLGYVLYVSLNVHFVPTNVITDALPQIQADINLVFGEGTM